MTAPATVFQSLHEVVEAVRLGRVSAFDVPVSIDGDFVSIDSERYALVSDDDEVGPALVALLADLGLLVTRR